MDILYINIIELKFIIHSLAPACNWPMTIGHYYSLCKGYLAIKDKIYNMQGCSQDFREGGADVCAHKARVQILTMPTYETERSKFKLSQRTRSECS